MAVRWKNCEKEEFGGLCQREEYLNLVWQTVWLQVIIRQL